MAKYASNDVMDAALAVIAAADAWEIEIREERVP
jgi:hypothetical protein